MCVRTCSFRFSASFLHRSSSSSPLPLPFLVLFITFWMFAAPSALAATTPAKKPYTNEELLTQMLVVDVSEQSLDNQPALSITFSQHIKEDAGFNRFITLTRGGKVVNGRWVMASNPRRLYFSHIEPNTEYRIQIRPGLVAEGNDLLLRHPVNQLVKTRNIEPAFDFASKGSILPARLTSGLPVRVVNVPELDVEFLRVKPDKLQTVLRAMRLDRKIRPWNLNDIHAATQSVYSNRYFTDAKNNARETFVLPVESVPELQKPGLYFAVIRQPGRFNDDAYRITHFTVTDIGLHARVYPRRLEVFVNSLATGKPLQDVNLTLQASKETLQVSTDEVGHGSFDRHPDGALLLMAEINGQFAFLDLREPALDLSEFPVTGGQDKPIAPFIYAPRDLYRPGERVDLSILLRDRDGLPTNVKNLNVRIVRPDTKILSERNVKAQNAKLGFFLERISIPGDAPTGRWQAEVRVNPESKAPIETFAFNVEDFLPERMKLELTTENKTLLAKQKQVVAVQGDYLYGSPASGNKVTASRTLKPDFYPFARYPDFHFGDSTEQDKAKRETLPDLMLNEQGSAFLDIPAVQAGLNSPLIMRVQASLHELGGRSVSRTLENTLWPASHMVGIRPLFNADSIEGDSEVDFEVLRLQANGALSPQAPLVATLVREEYEYFWEFTRQEGWQRKETRNEYPLKQQTLLWNGQQAQALSFSVGRGRYRLEIEDADTQRKAVYSFYAGWYADEQQIAKRPDHIELSLDKPAYQVGDVARLTIKPPARSEAVVTVEAKSLLWQKRVSLSRGETQVDIPVADSWARHDLYVSVTAFRPASREEKISPNRAFGVIHLPLDRSNRQLALSIEAPQKTLPERSVEVKVNAAELRGQEAVVTLAAVDVGVLNITGFETPNPFDYYFAKHAYTVDLHDAYGKVIETMEGKTLRQRFGGDKGRSAGGAVARADVQIVALFSGVQAFDENGVATVSLPIPGFDGQLRLMALAATETRMGSTDADMMVTSPVVASLTAPRFLSAGDTASATVELRNTTAVEQSVTFSLGASRSLAFTSSSWKTRLAAGERKVFKLPLAARHGVGKGFLRLKMVGATFEANRRVGVVLRPSYPASFQRQVKSFAAADETQRFDAAFVEQLLPDTVKARLTVSNVPVLSVGSALNHLLTYPYGCLEQTTSAAYPYLFLEARVTERLGLPAISMPQRTQKIQQALLRLSGMQLANGGFTLWGNYGVEEFWLSPYVMQFLLAAEEEGFPVPERMLNKGMTYLQERLQEGYRPVRSRYAQSDSPEHMDFASRAYAAYVLALRRKAKLGTLRAVYDAESEKVVAGLPLVHMGLALRLMGDKRRGTAAIQRGLALGRIKDKYLGDYGSDLRDEALMLQLLLKHKVTVPALATRLQALSAKVRERRYLSTQEQLALFLLDQALAKRSDQRWQARLAVAGNELDLNKSGSYRRAIMIGELREGVALTSLQSEPLYASLEIDGYPLQAPAVENDVIAVKRRWYSMQGKPLDASALKVGDLVLTHLEVTSKQAINDALVVDLLPAALEIENIRLTGSDDFNNVVLQDINKPVSELLISGAVRHEEFRDDRYMAAVALTKERTHHLFYAVRVVSAGRYQVPPPLVEDMYRPELRGVGKTPGTITIQ